MPAPVIFYPNFLTNSEADTLFGHCRDLNWKQNTLQIKGREILIPRLECLVGDAGCNYLYSNSVLLKPEPWSSQLSSLREKLEAFTDFKYQVVFANRYRTGKDSVGWHSDNERSLGAKPAIG